MRTGGCECAALRVCLHLQRCVRACAGGCAGSEQPGFTGWCSCWPGLPCSDRRSLERHDALAASLLVDCTQAAGLQWPPTAAVPHELCLLCHLASDRSGSPSSRAPAGRTAPQLAEPQAGLAARAQMLQSTVSPMAGQGHQAIGVEGCSSAQGPPGTPPSRCTSGCSPRCSCGTPRRGTLRWPARTAPRWAWPRSRTWASG